MGKIENDYQLKISRKRVEGLKRALHATKEMENPDVRQMCEDSTRFMLEKIEREIEEYLAQKAAEKVAEKTPLHSASA
ncbi:hypothetical protein HYR99_35095 [Candidatus Poribacteria bacterium]|nr:hypothetical protein [Candidatus Poribacteria bacterium]